MEVNHSYIYINLGISVAWFLLFVLTWCYNKFVKSLEVKTIFSVSSKFRNLYSVENIFYVLFICGIFTSHGNNCITGPRKKSYLYWIFNKSSTNPQGRVKWHLLCVMKLSIFYMWPTVDQEMLTSVNVVISLHEVHHTNLTQQLGYRWVMDGSPSVLRLDVMITFITDIK